MSDRGPRRGVGHARHDWDGDESLSYTVVEAVAAATGCDPVEVSSLGTDVDLEALDQYIRSLGGQPGRASFTADGVHVTVTSEGTVTARRTTDGDRPDDAWFATMVARLVRKAARAGVDVAGGWGVRDAATDREWGIEIVEVWRRH